MWDILLSRQRWLWPLVVALLAAGAALAWDLRCEVREKLVDFIRREYPHALPRLRAELKKGECQ